MVLARDDGLNNVLLVRVRSILSLYIFFFFCRLESRTRVRDGYVPEGVASFIFVVCGAFVVCCCFFFFFSSLLVILLCGDDVADRALATVRLTRPMCAYTKL